MATTHRTGQGEMLDLICLRHYGPREGVVERVLDVNPGLADKGAVLPLGTLVQLPDLPVTLTTAATIKLWD
jgi:phage tail protein X